MKKSSVYKLILLSAGLLLCLFILEKIVDFGTRHNLNIKSSYVATHTINAQLLVLGPCEPLWMVSPAILKKNTGLTSYNLANSHSDFADNYLHLYLYLQNNEAPKTLLLFVTPESFDTNYNTFYSYRFSAWLNDPVVAEVVKDCDPDFSRWNRIPFLKYGYFSHQADFLALQGLKHYFSGKELPHYPDGFEPPAKIVWDNHYENLMLSYPKGYRFSWSEQRAKYLQKIIGLCREKRIELILYESPILKEIADYQFNRDLYVQKIDEIAKKNDLQFLKFEDLSWAKGREHFISPMVTTLEGSLLFSDTLAKSLKRINAQ